MSDLYCELDESDIDRMIGIGQEDADDDFSCIDDEAYTAHLLLDETVRYDPSEARNNDDAPLPKPPRHRPSDVDHLIRNGWHQVEVDEPTKKKKRFVYYGPDGEMASSIKKARLNIRIHHTLAAIDDQVIQEIFGESESFTAAEK